MLMKMSMRSVKALSVGNSSAPDAYVETRGNWLDGKWMPANLDYVGCTDSDKEAGLCR